MRSPVGRPPRPRLPRIERERIVLDTAARLFYARGVHEVGMDEMVRETSLGRATGYRLYPTKDALIGAYVTRRSGATLAMIDDAGSGSPGDAVRAVLDAVRADLASDGFRGCALTNASIEYADLDHPARVAAREYRRLLLARLSDFAGRLLAGRPARASRLGAELAVLIDGACTSAAHLGPDGPADAGVHLAHDLVRQAERTPLPGGRRSSR